jgi:hypothetical protein
MHPVRSSWRGVPPRAELLRRGVVHQLLHANELGLFDYAADHLPDAAEVMLRLAAPNGSRSVRGADG